MWWLGDWIRLILHQLPLPRKSPEKGKNYFGLYLLVGGRKPYTIWNPIWKRPSHWPGPTILCPRPLPPGTWPKASDEADGNTGRPQPGFFRITGKKYFVLYLRWLGEGNFLVQILCGGSVIGYD